MHVEERGAFSFERGVVVRVLIGAKHKIYKEAEALLIYDVFHPATI